MRTIQALGATVRIIRKQTPPRMDGLRGYQRAQPHLRIDFEYRCAYCRIREENNGSAENFQIDHFQPTSKGGARNRYDNLFWACRGCNGFKSDHWPTEVEAAQGYRFANPCEEMDYGVHFYEVADGTLVAQTKCGEYHVARLRLNRLSRKGRRSRRYALKQKITEARIILADLSREPSLDFSHLRLLSKIANQIDELEIQLENAQP